MQTRVFRTSLLFVLIYCNSHLLFSEDQTPVSDPQALALAAKATAALTSGVPVTDVTLTANANWIAGSDEETGSATLQAKGTGESRIDLELSGGTRSWIRNDIASVFPQGASTDKGGPQQSSAMHNCWTSASWFFPALSLLGATTDPTLIFTYVGQETRGEITVEHLRVSRYLADKRPMFRSITQRVSTTEFYLDSSSLLPVAMTFNTHPDDDANTDISLEIDFSKYQSVNGVQIPFHIQKLINGGLALDLVVTNVSLNSGLSDDLFAIQGDDSK